MAKRTSLKNDSCPVARSMEAIGDCWSMLIIRDAMLGKKRFGEFQKSLGVAKNILATRLRDLVDDGLLTLRPAADGSAYQDYVLTEKGRAVFPIMVALRQWAEDYAFKPGEAPDMMVDLASGQRVRKLELRAADGRLLRFGEVTLKPAATSAPT